MCNDGSECAGCWIWSRSKVHDLHDCDFQKCKLWFAYINSYLFMSKLNFTLMMRLAKQFWSVKQFFSQICFFLCIFVSFVPYLFFPFSFCLLCSFMPIYIISQIILVFWTLFYVASKQHVGPLRKFPGWILYLAYKPDRMPVWIRTMNVATERVFPKWGLTKWFGGCIGNV